MNWRSLRDSVITVAAWYAVIAIAFYAFLAVCHAIAFLYHTLGGWGLFILGASILFLLLVWLLYDKDGGGDG